MYVLLFPGMCGAKISPPGVGVSYARGGDYTAGRGRLDSCSVIGCYSMTSGYAMSRDSV